MYPRTFSMDAAEKYMEASRQAREQFQANSLAANESLEETAQAVE